MTRIDVSPFRALSNNDEAVVALPPECIGLPWDMDTRLTVSRRAAVDVDAIRERCGLSAEAKLAIVHTVRCDATYWTADAVRELPMSGTADVRVDLDVPVRTVAKSLKHHLSVVLAAAAGPGVVRSATGAGSILWEAPTRTIDLEGTSNQFPTDVVSFARTGRNAQARWTLEYDYDSVDAPVLGAIRLLLNADSPLIAVLVDRSRDEAHAGVAAQLGADLRRFVISDIIRQAVADDRFQEGHDAAEESVAALVAAVLDRYAHASLDDLRPLAVTDRPRFEQLLQSVVVDVMP